MTREERVALDAYRGVSEVVHEDGGVVVLTVPQAPGVPMLNRVVGLGVDGPATEAALDAALGVIPAGVTYYVAVAPGALPLQLPGWLEARGLERGWGWMSFRRSPADPPLVETALLLRRVADGADAAAFARIQRVAYGLPEALEPLLVEAAQRGWECWLALDGDEPAGAGALFVREAAAYLGFGATLPEHRAAAYLGFGATLPEHRGKGAQGALLAHRIARAGELGCDVVLTETGEHRDDLPSSSYRNIIRAGFEEVAVTANWVGNLAASGISLREITESAPADSFRA